MADSQRRELLPVAVLLLALACGGCSPLAWGIAGGAAGIGLYAPSRLNHAYQTQYQPPVVRPVEADSLDVRVGFVEFDDFGWMRDTLQVRALLDELEALHRKTSVAVVVYAHGWRHNAKEDDGDVRAFRATLRHLGHSLNDSTLRAGRAALTGDTNVTVYGIYVGWRGKAWPELGRVTQGWPSFLKAIGPAALDWPVYLTSFSRKQTAGVVGTGDVRGFLLRLDDMHREINARARRDPVAVKPMGLVYVGHSYGGHLIFSALSGRIEDAMGTAISGFMAHGRSGISGRIYPTERATATVRCDSTIRGVGDLVILVNPAIEAAAYRRIEGMVRTTTFSPEQLPLMLTVSAENDVARKGVFRVMKWLQLVGRARLGREQPELERHAFGSFDRQVTHRMELTGPGEGAKRAARIKVLEKGVDQLGARRTDDAAAARDRTPRTMLPADVFAQHDHGVVRMRADPGQDSPRPALVVRSSKLVIDGHSDFFRVEFIDWLTDYVQTIEQVRLAHALRAAKRMAAR